MKAICIFRLGCIRQAHCVKFCNSDIDNMSNYTMNIIKSQSLGDVVRPLVQVMVDANLSWSDREKLSLAIHATHLQWTAMEKERHSTNSINAGQTLGYGYGQAQAGLPPQAGVPENHR